MEINEEGYFFSDGGKCGIGRMEARELKGLNLQGTMGMG
jgi:hypothetical protein